MKDINIGDKVVGIAGATRVTGTVLNIKEGHVYIKAPVSGVYAPIVRAVPINKVAKLQESHMKAKMPERTHKDDDSGMDDYLASHEEEEKKKEEEEKKKKKELEEGLFSKEPKGVEYYRKLHQQSRQDHLKRVSASGAVPPKPVVPKAKTAAEIEMADAALRKTNRSQGYDPRNTNTSAVSSKYKQMWTRKARYDAEREAAGKGPSKVIPTVKKVEVQAPAKKSLGDRIKGFFKLKEETVDEGMGALSQALGMRRGIHIPLLPPTPIRKPKLSTRLKEIVYDLRTKKIVKESKVRSPNHTHAVTRRGEIVSYHPNSNSAQKRADKLDQQYGSTVHSVKPLEEGVFSSVRDKIGNLLNGPKKDVRYYRELAQQSRAENLARAKAKGMKPVGSYTNPFTGETTRGKDSRSEADANRALTTQRPLKTRIKENAMLMVSGTKPVRVIKRGVEGKGRGNKRTHTGQIANDVAIYKESKDD